MTGVQTCALPIYDGLALRYRCFFKCAKPSSTRFYRCRRSNRNDTPSQRVSAVDAWTNWIDRDVRSLGEWHYNRREERSQAAAKPSSNTQPRDRGQNPEVCRTGTGRASFGDGRIIISEFRTGFPPNLGHRRLRLHLSFRLDSAKPRRVAFSSSANAVKRKWAGFHLSLILTRPTNAETEATAPWHQTRNAAQIVPLASSRTG